MSLDGASKWPALRCDNNVETKQCPNDARFPLRVLENQVYGAIAHMAEREAHPNAAEMAELATRENEYAGKMDERDRLIKQRRYVDAAKLDTELDQIQERVIALKASVKDGHGAARRMK